VLTNFSYVIMHSRMHEQTKNRTAPVANCHGRHNKYTSFNKLYRNDSQQNDVTKEWQILYQSS